MSTFQNNCGTSEHAQRFSRSTETLLLMRTPQQRDMQGGLGRFLVLTSSSQGFIDRRAVALRTPSPDRHGAVDGLLSPFPRLIEGIRLPSCEGFRHKLYRGVRPIFILIQSFDRPYHMFDVQRRTCKMLHSRRQKANWLERASSVLRSLDDWRGQVVRCPGRARAGAAVAIGSALRRSHV
jgi:hypothetical protein